MSSTSVSLESLQFLLQHMDANKRFEIYIRCPSLRAIERSVPLKIEALKFNKGSVDVNGTRYNLGIIRKYNAGEAPDFVALENMIGEVQHEVDRYGIEDMTDGTTVAPGDVGINREGGQLQQNDEDAIRSLEIIIQLYELMLDQQRDRPLDDYTENLYERARAKLFAYQCRRDNIPPNYKHFLQLTISRVGGEQEKKIIERYNHTKKYSEALRQLTTMMFGERSSSIHVKKFDFNCQQGVVRLPVGLRFQIEKLLFGGDVPSTLEALAPIIHKSSYPLKRLELDTMPIHDAANHIVRAAGVLIIRSVSRNIPRTISAITNPMVRIVIYSLSEEILEEIIANWIESKRPIKTEYVIFIRSEPEFSDEMEDILKSFNGVPMDDENVIFAMNDAAQLKITYGPFPEFAPRAKYAVRFLTEAIEN